MIVSKKGELCIKPPLGIRPQWYIMEERAQEILQAIERFNDQDYKIPNQWLSELDTIGLWLKTNVPDSIILKDIYP